MSFIKTSECTIVSKPAKVGYIICDKCGTEYLAMMGECPNCKVNNEKK